MMMQHSMKFDMSNGFPMITERNVCGFWRKAISELCAFINGATTVDELERFGCDWWAPWGAVEFTEPLGLPVGSLGPGCCGGAFARFPTASGSHVDQFEYLVEQIREFSDARTHFVSPWIPEYQVMTRGRRRQVTVAPCHGWVHVRVIGGQLHLHLFQRAADVPIGLPGNMIEYAALLLMLAQVTGFAAGWYYHTISDAHIYLEQLPAVEQMLSRQALRLPTVCLTDVGRAIYDIHEFRADHFELRDYFPHPAISGIPVPI